MFRIDDSTAAAVAPAIPAAGTQGFFTEGSPGSGIPATRIRDWWLNMVQEELRGLVTDAGLTPTKTTWSQVSEAVRRMAGSNVRTLTADTQLTADDAGLVLVDASGGARTYTLPAANAAGGRPMRFTFFRTDATTNAVIIQRAGADTIEGATSFTLSGQAAKAEIRADGVGRWIALAGGPAPDTVPAGTVLFTTLVSPPAGYIKANGAVLSRTAYSRLFAAAMADGMVTEAAWAAGATGRFSSGDGATTFRIPDLRGEFLRGWDDGRGVDSGRFHGTLQRGTLGVYDQSSSVATADSVRTTFANFNADFVDLTAYGSPQHSYITGVTIQTATADAVGAVRPRNVALLACIKF